MTTISLKECISAFVNALKEQNAAIFAGAGLSKESGFVDWKDLMKDIVDDLGLDISKETDLIALAQYHINERFGNRHRINQTIIDHFTKNTTSNRNHRILANLPISTYWTTNYDELIENSIREAGKNPDIKINSTSICITTPKRDAIIYKMHGDVSNPDEAILTKEDYETYENSRALYSTLLQSDLFSKTFLFIGFSFDDPNLMYILTRVKNLIGTKATRNHFCFFKKEVDPEKSRKQELRLNDLARYGILSILIDDYPEITNILQQISDLYQRSQVFISGAAVNFSEFDNKERATEFIHLLSRELVSHEYKIISGFGNNVGSAVINGALEYIFSTNHRKLDDYLKLMPFPHYVSGLTNQSQDKIDILKKERNQRYRDLMISQAGIAIFIFGNKEKNEKIVLSNGMREEFSHAKEKKLKPIPIGATGYMAREIWQEVISNFDSFYGNHGELKDSFLSLGDKTKSNAELVKIVLHIIRTLNKY